MYSHVICFRFDATLPLIERMRFLTELFAIPEQVGARTSDIYWLRMNTHGDVEFYSNTPDLTAAIEHHIDSARARGMKLPESGFAADRSFLFRVARGWLVGAFAWMRRGKRE